MPSQPPPKGEVQGLLKWKLWQAFLFRSPYIPWAFFYLVKIRPFIHIIGKWKIYYNTILLVHNIAKPIKRNLICTSIPLGLIFVLYIYRNLFFVLLISPQLRIKSIQNALGIQKQLLCNIWRSDLLCWLKLNSFLWIKNLNMLIKIHFMPRFFLKEKMVCVTFTSLE